MPPKLEAARISEMYDYMIAPGAPLPEYSDASFVFCRKSSHLVEAAVAAHEHAGFTVVSGSFGKDSGDSPFTEHYGTPEAEYMLESMRDQGGFDLGGPIFMELKARTGRENARYGLAMVTRGIARVALSEDGSRSRVPAFNLIATGHSTQARRLKATMQREIDRTSAPIDRFVFHPSNYPFNPKNPFDQYEVASEVEKVAQLGEEVPKEMLEYAIYVAAYRKVGFKRAGIKNPSTADDTVRGVSPVRAMLLPNRPWYHANRSRFAARHPRTFYPGNALQVARAAFRETLGR
ncbi:MAG TPA: hypothetical protein VJP80_07445 [Candidatus Saccharimonadales bacterium]|nr:hypothetical protein [Candidatus Saccharimonadales bacterium]